MTGPGGEAWTDACLAAALLAVDPAGLGGARLRARAGPARDAWLGLFAACGSGREALRLPPGIADDRLIGGLDLAATLAAGRPVHAAGLLETAAGRTLILPMAERATPALAARLNAARDRGAAFTLILLDEGAAPEEAPPAALIDRLAFAPWLDDVALADLATPPAAWNSASAQARLPAVRTPEDLAETLVTLAAALGIGSLRAPMLCLRAARAAAALAGTAVVGEAAATAAARLVLAPRATRLPEAVAPEDQPRADPPPPESAPPQEGSGEDRRCGAIPDAVLLEAVRAAIPADVLARLIAGAAFRAPGARADGSGDERKTRARGRPAGAMRGNPREGGRIDLVETLRAAAPWQPLRRSLGAGDAARVLVREEDFRIKRAKHRAEKVVVFVVDASGSTALARLAETKGAIELMLAQAYVARQQVALIAFRGAGAEVLLPPTRSLVMTKRRLASLPGGGGTPLAAGLAEALALAGQATARGIAPYLAVLTDGRANVALDGAPGRAQAGVDALRIARALRAAEARALVIDTGNRPSPPARELADAMGAGYLPLPRADARTLSGAMQSALAGAA